MGHKANNIYYLTFYKVRRPCSRLKISFCDPQILESALSSFDYKWDD